MSNVVSLIPRGAHEATAKQALRAEGFGEGQIAILLKPADVWERLGGHQKAKIVLKTAATGALGGMVIGVLYGVPAGLSNCKVMGCPVSTSLLFLGLISAYWVIAGAVVGAVVGLDRLERPLYSYVEGVRRGESLIIVETSPEETATVKSILRRDSGSVIREMETR